MHMFCRISIPLIPDFSFTGRSRDPWRFVLFYLHNITRLDSHVFAICKNDKHYEHEQGHAVRYMNQTNPNRLIQN